MKPLQLLTFVSTVLTVFTIPASADTKYWCGKPYTPRTPKTARSLIPRELLTESLWKRATSANATSNDPATITIPVTTNPVPQVPNLSNGYAAMVRIQPYLSTDNQGSLVINVANGTGSVSVQASLVDGTEVLPKTSVNVKDMAVEVPFSISNISPRTTPYTLKIQLGNNVIYAKLYRLPAGPKTVKIDRLTGATITSTGTPIFPVGPYVDFGWLGQGDIAANLKTLKGLGYNVINPDPTYTDLSLVDKLFQAADALGGIYIQLSFRYSFTQTAQVVQQVNRFKTYSSLLTWYTADEPDGEQWTDSSAELTVYNAIKGADPYHPVALVLNCQNTGAFYADTTDILGTDVYPVGVDMSHCTDTNDVCGCDDCLGSATLDVPKRTTRYMQDLTLIGRQAINQWMVLQAFSDPATWWSKMPTPAEFRVMSYISIVNGYKSIMFWKYPFTPNDSLKAQITQIANDAQTLSPYIIQMQQLPATHFTTTTKNLYYGGWMSLDTKSFMVIVINGDPSNTVQYSLTVQDLTKNGKLSGTGNVDSSGKQNATMNNGVLTGSLKAYEVGWFTFGVPPPKLSNSTTSNAAGPSGTNSNGTSSSDSTKSAATKISLESNIVFLVGALVAGLLVLV